MSHGGMFVNSTTGGVGATPLDMRMVNAATWGAYFGVVTGGGVTLSTTAMTASVPQSVWQLIDPNNSNAVYRGVTDLYAFTIATAPSSGTRVDIIEVRQDDPDYGDSDPYTLIQYVEGSGSTAPTADAGWTTAYQITVPSTATVASKCTVSTLAPSVQDTPRRLFTWDDTSTTTYTTSVFNTDGVRATGSFTLYKTCLLQVSIGQKGQGTGIGNLTVSLDTGAIQVASILTPTVTPNGVGAHTGVNWNAATFQLTSGTHTVTVTNSYGGDSASTTFSPKTGLFTMNGVAYSRAVHVDLIG